MTDIPDLLCNNRMRIQSKAGHKMTKRGEDAIDTGPSQSICSGCGNAYAHKCVWFGKGQPVPGWMASKSMQLFKNDHHEIIKRTAAYEVHDCPNFTPDGRRRVPFGFESEVIRG